MPDAAPAERVVVVSPMKAGQPYSISITMKNSGSVTWSGGSDFLNSINSPANLWGINVVPIPNGQTVAPGASRTFTFTIKAPATPGTYSSAWVMRSNAVGRFAAPATLQVSVASAVDYDTAALVVSAPALSNKTTENGGQVAFTVALASQPPADVTLPVASTKPTEGKPDRSQLVFTAANWKVAQTVTVMGQADGVLDGTNPTPCRSERARARTPATSIVRPLSDS